MAEAEIIAIGEAAHRHVAAMKGKVEPYTVKTGTVMGDVTLEPGMTWSGYNKIIIYPSSFGVYYMNGDTLYRQDVKDFIRDELLSAFEKAGKSAKPWIKIAKVQFEFIMGLVAPWFITLGLFCGKVVYYYVTYTELINAAYKHSGTLLESLIWLRKQSPTLFEKLMMSAGKAILKDMPNAISAEDIAFFMGRVLMNFKNVAGQVEAAGKLSLGTAIWIILKVAGVVGLLRAPSIAIKAGTAISRKMIEDVRKEIAYAGVPCSDQDAEKIIKELQAGNSETAKMMGQLKESSEQLTPLLEKLASIMNAED